MAFQTNQCQPKHILLVQLILDHLLFRTLSEVWVSTVSIPPTVERRTLITTSRSRSFNELNPPSLVPVRKSYLGRVFVSSFQKGLFSSPSSSGHDISRGLPASSSLSESHVAESEIGLPFLSSWMYCTRPILVDPIKTERRSLTDCSFSLLAFVLGLTTSIVDAFFLLSASLLSVTLVLSARTLRGTVRFLDGRLLQTFTLLIGSTAFSPRVWSRSALIASLILSTYSRTSFGISFLDSPSPDAGDPGEEDDDIVVDKDDDSEHESISESIWLGSCSSPSSSITSRRDWVGVHLSNLAM